MNELIFDARIIETVEINSEISSNCKLRSKFVHEKIFQSRARISENSIRLNISEKGVKMFRSADQMLLSSHSIQRISYSACDRINHLFALVVRSCEVNKGHFCYVFRMNNGEDADSINRYFGTIFKKLHNRKKEKRSKSSSNIVESKEICNERGVELYMAKDNELDDPCLEGQDPRLKQISTSKIGELVSEKHNLRRLSLCMLTSELEDSELNDQPLHSSLEKKYPAQQNNNALAFVRRKKPEYKSNRISAVIERLSFRSSREIGSDFMKSGSPVVALKEQLEYEHLLSASSSLESDKQLCEPRIPVAVPRSQSKRQLLPSHSNLHINNDSKAAHQVFPSLFRKNSAPICNLEEEQPPVPPVRIHSLRNTSFPRSLNIAQSTQHARGYGEGASSTMPQHDYDENNDDDHLSSITTPSSCGHPERPITFGMCKEPPPASLMNSAHLNVPLSFFRDFTKEEAMDFLLDRKVGSFIVRHSASHANCTALSVKVADNLVSHYIVRETSVGFQMKGLDHKSWPTLESLIIHLSVIPEMLPCPLIIAQSCAPSRAVYFPAEVPQIKSKNLPQSNSADDEYHERMKYFLNDLPASQDHYQQLSDFSSIIAGLDSA